MLTSWSICPCTSRLGQCQLAAGRQGTRWRAPTCTRWHGSQTRSVIAGSTQHRQQHWWQRGHCWGTSGCHAGQLGHVILQHVCSGAAVARSAEAVANLVLQSERVQPAVEPDPGPRGLALEPEAGGGWVHVAASRVRKEGPKGLRLQGPIHAQQPDEHATAAAAAACCSSSGMASIEHRGTRCGSSEAAPPALPAAPQNWQPLQRCPAPHTNRS